MLNMNETPNPREEYDDFTDDDYAEMYLSDED